MFRSLSSVKCLLLAGVLLTAAGAQANRLPAKTWPCRPEPVEASDYFTPDRIYLASRPSVLPDGKRFIFEWCNAIWIAPIEGGKAKVLQHSGGRDAWPLVSRDGKRFAFQSNRSGGWHTFVAPIEEGGKARQIGFNSEAERPYLWSHDGKQLLCLVYRDDRGSAFDQARLAWLPVDERAAEKRLFDAPASEPSLSPDGRYVLFTQEGEDLYRKGFTGENASRIWCYDTQTGAFTLAVKHPTESRMPLWAPDGKGFYYVSGQGGTQNIWWHAFPGMEEKQLTFFTGDSVIHPSLSEDGTMMVFRQGFDFWSFNPQTPQVAPKRIDLHAENSGLARSPTRRRHYDGLWNNDEGGSLDATSGGLELAFTTGGDVYVMDTVLRDPKLVYGDSRTHEREAVFSKDSSQLYILSDRGDSIALLVAEKARKELFWWENSDFTVRPLIEDSIRRRNLTVSPDGTRLAWVETDSVLTIANRDGSIVRRFPKVKQIGSYDWSPDGRWIVASMSDDYANFDIWLLNIENRDIKPYNLSRSFTWDGSPDWSPDGKLIVWNGLSVGSGSALFYVWLNRQDEETLRTQDYSRAIEHMGLNLEKDRRSVFEVLAPTVSAAPDPNSPNAVQQTYGAATEPAEPENRITIDLDGLHERVRVTPVAGLGAPTFAPDSRRVLFPATIANQAGTYEVTIPSQLSPKLLSSNWGYPVGWFGRDPDPKRADKMIMIRSNLKIGTLNEIYPFNVYQELNLQDYYELGFLLAWGTLRDYYYDPEFHGADWNAIRTKYQAAARFVPYRVAFERIIHALNGELNSSHLGFYADKNSTKEWDRSTSLQSWEPVTSHLGVVFDQNYTGDVGWMVHHVIPGSPADSGLVGLKPGDLIVSIDGKPIQNRMDPTLLLNGPKTGRFVIEIRSGDKTRRAFIESITYAKARELVVKDMYRDRRAYVHQRSGGSFGYINITAMNNDEYNRFEREIFAEGFDKAGMVIDVRDNVGGFTADKVLNILGAQRHSWSVPRHGNPAYLASYWGRPVFDRPIVVLCNQNTVSNGEIFSHAIKQLKRGKLVGVQTNGGVIATNDAPLLDLGTLRRAHYGWYTLDGTDMELHGAVPDVIVENTPADTAAGRDPQLDAAIDVLLQEVEKFDRENKPFVPNTYKWNHQL